MQTVIQGWSRQGFLLRLGITVLTGVTWAVRSVQAVLVDPDYVIPVTAADFFAVYSYSAAWLLTAASLVTLHEVVRPALGHASSAVLVVAAACAVAGLANAVEDGLQLKALGLVYVIGALVGGFGMFGLAALLWQGSARRLALVPAIGGIAMVTITIGGGVLGLVAWPGFAVFLVGERSRPRVGASAA